MSINNSENGEAALVRSLRRLRLRASLKTVFGALDWAGALSRNEKFVQYQKQLWRSGAQAPVVSFSATRVFIHRVWGS